MVFDFFAGDNFLDSKDVNAWSGGVEQEDLKGIISNIIDNSDLGEGEEIVIVIRPEYEGC